MEHRAYFRDLCAAAVTTRMLREGEPWGQGLRWGGIGAGVWTTQILTFAAQGSTLAAGGAYIFFLKVRRGVLRQTHTWQDLLFRCLSARAQGTRQKRRCQTMFQFPNSLQACFNVFQSLEAEHQF